MPEEIKSMLDAISSAVETPAPAAAAPPEPIEAVDPPEPETPETPVAEPDAGGAKPAGEKPVEDEKPAEGEKPIKDAKPEGEKPEGEKLPEDEKPKKELDPINDPIPPTVSERTRERITSLISAVKERDTIVQQHNELVDTINGTGASPDEFAAMISYMRLVHSPNIEDRRQAYAAVMNELKGLAPLIGEVLPGEDALAGHEDLVNAVAAQSMSREHAVELAQARNRTKAVEGNREQLTQQQQADQQWERERQAGISDLNALEVELKGKDKDYDAKNAHLVPLLKPLFAQLHPSRWRAAFADAYARVNLPAATVAPASSKLPAGQPLRANKQPSGDGQRQPTSMLEAMNAGLAELSK
jgi:hypothetical protein